MLGVIWDVTIYDQQPVAPPIEGHCQDPTTIIFHDAIIKNTFCNRPRYQHCHPSLRTVMRADTAVHVVCVFCGLALQLGDFEKVGMQLLYSYNV
jgi:hypothetical protein